MKKYIIRQLNKCGHWSIFKIIDVNDFDSKILYKMFINSLYSKNDNWDFMVIEVAHLETFSDVLVLLNVGVVGNGIYR